MASRDGTPPPQPPPQPERVVCISKLKDADGIYEPIFRQDVIDKLLQDHKDVDQNKIVVLSITGEQNSGKSFLLNVLLHYLRSKGDGGWMNRLEQRKDRLWGFYMDEADEKSDVDGIYVWPELFPLKTEGPEGGRKWLMILDVVNLDGEKEKMHVADQILALWSSFIINNSMKTFKSDFLSTLGDMEQVLNQRDGQIPSDLCTHIHFIVRDASKMSKNKTLNSILDSISDEENKKLFDRLKDSFDGSFLNKPNDKQKAVIDENGYVNFDTAFSRNLKPLCRQILDADSLTPKEFKGGFYNYLFTCCKVIEGLQLAKFQKLKDQQQAQKIGCQKPPQITQAVADIQKLANIKKLKDQQQEIGCQKDPEIPVVADTQEAGPETNNINGVDNDGTSVDFGILVNTDIEMKDETEQNEKNNSSSLSINSVQTEWSGQSQNQLVSNTKPLIQIKVSKDQFPEEANSQQKQAIAVQSSEVASNSSSGADTFPQDQSKMRNPAPKSTFTCDNMQSEISQQQFHAKIAETPQVSTTARNITTVDITYKEERHIILSNCDRDDMIHEKVQMLKSHYMNSILPIKDMIDEETQDKLHRDASSDCTVKFRHFLSNKFPDLTASRKQEKVKLLEIALDLEFNRIKAKLKKSVTREPSVAINIPEGTSEHFNPSEHYTVNKEPEEAMDCSAMEDMTSSLKSVSLSSENTSATTDKHCSAQQETPDAPQAPHVTTNGQQQDKHSGNGEPDTQMEIDSNSKDNETEKFESKFNAIFEEFEKQASPFFRKLVDNDLIIPEGKFRTMFSECKRKFHLIIKKHKIDLSQEGIKDLLHQGVENVCKNYKNQIDEINSQAEQLLQNTKEKFKMDLEKSITNWVNEFTNLDNPYKRSWFNDFTNSNNCYKKSWSTLFGEMLSKYNEDFYVLKRHSGLRQQFIRQLSDNTEIADWKTKLLALESALKFYEDQIEAKFSKFRCFPINNFDHHHQDFLSKAVTKLFSGGINQDSRYHAIFAKGIQKYASQFQDRNTEINQLEKESASETADHEPMHFYREIMTKLTAGRIFKPEDLQKRHEAAVKEILHLLNNAFDFKGAPEITDITDNLENKLLKEFQTFVNNNKINITKVTTEARIAVTTHRTTYNEKMENAIRGESKSKEELEKKHKSVVEEVVKSLEFEIKKLEFSISPEEHVADLRQRVGKDWIELQNANEKRAKEAKKLEAKRQLEDQEEKAQKKKAAEVDQKIIENKITLSTPNPPVNKSISPKMTPRPSAAASIPLVDLPPMAIAFTPTYVTIGCIFNRGFEQINDKWGNQEIPIKLGVLQNDEIVIGSEAEERFQHDKFGMEFYTSNKIMSFTGEGESHPFRVKKFPGRVRTLRSEGLCGLFLAAIKSDIEKRLNGRWSDVVITVPLGYTSVQRQAMKDAATIAGFSKVFLINETSAAALFLANEPIRTDSKNCLIVGVSSEDYFDAAVYEYERGSIQMLASCGNLHASNLQESQKGLFRWIKSIPKAIYKFGFGSQPVNEIQAFMKPNISPHLDNIKEGLCVNYGSEKGLENAIGTYARLVHKAYGHTCILQGATYFAQLLCFKGGNERVKDMASYVFNRSPTHYSSTRDSSKIIFDLYQKLPTTKMMTPQCLGHLKSSGFRVKIEECSLDNQFYIGNFEIQLPNDSSPKPRDSQIEVTVKFSVNNEGIFRTEEASYQVCTKGVKMKAIYPISFEWNSPNLNSKEKLELTELVASLQKDEANEAFEKSKKELTEFVLLLEPLIPEVKSLIGRNFMEREIAEAKAKIEHSSTTMEQMQKKLDTLVALKSKYVPDK